jgi:hypothetical protein
MPFRLLLKKEGEYCAGSARARECWCVCVCVCGSDLNGFRTYDDLRTSPARQSE